jgi:hypothetical protein
MNLNARRINVTLADTSGTSSTVDGAAVFGLLEAVQWIDGTYADGVDAVLACVNADSGVDQTLLTLTNADADAWYYPRAQIDDQAGAAETFNSTEGLSLAHIVLNGTLKLTVTSAGSTAGLTGGCVVYYLS